MSQPPNQPYPGQPHPGQPYPGRPGAEQPWPSPPGSGPPHPGQPYPGQPQQGAEQPWSSQQPHPSQPQPGQQQPGQPYPGQPAGEQPWSSPPGPGQSYPGRPGYPGQGQPNPDVPAAVPPQPGFPPSYAPQQPAYGQPDHAQHSYAQPGYPQSGPPMAGYPQSGYPQSGPPMTGYPPPPPQKKSRAVPITLVSIALVLVVCVGGGSAVYLAGRNTAQGVVATLPTAGPVPSVTTRAPRAVISIVEPRRLSGRPQVTDPKFAALVDQLEKNLALLPNASQTVGAIYGTPAERDVVMVVAAKSFIIDPKEEVDEAFAGDSFSKLKLTGIASVPAGPLGGAAKCAKGSDSGVRLAMCAWADEGSSGLVIWYFTSLSKAQDEFVSIRGQIEKKSS